MVTAAAWTMCEAHTAAAPVVGGDPTPPRTTKEHIVAVHASKHGDPGDYCLSRVWVRRPYTTGWRGPRSVRPRFPRGLALPVSDGADVKVSGHHARVDVAAAAAAYSARGPGTVTPPVRYRGDDAAALLWAPYDREWRAAGVREGPSFGHKVTGSVAIGREIRMVSERDRLVPRGRPMVPSP